MSFVQTVIWGLVVGLSEILPVSGSAHVAFLEKIFGFQGARMEQRLFYGLLDLGLLIGILLFYRREAASLLRAVHRMFARKNTRSRRTTDREDQRLALMLLISLVPLALELLLQRWTDTLYRKPLFWAACLIFSGLALFIFEYLSRGSKDARQMRVSDALIVGACQAVAVLPGLSRSGLMITAGYGRGFKADFSVRYAFLLSIPFLFGSGIIKVVQAVRMGVQAAYIPAYLVGMVVCIFSAIGGLHLIHRSLSRKRLSMYAFYCWGAAAFSLFLFLIT